MAPRNGASFPWGPSPFLHFIILTLFRRTAAALHWEWVHTFVDGVFAWRWLGSWFPLNRTSHKSL